MCRLVVLELPRAINHSRGPKLLWFNKDFQRRKEVFFAVIEDCWSLVPPSLSRATLSVSQSLFVCLSFSECVCTCQWTHRFCSVLHRFCSVLPFLVVRTQSSLRLELDQHPTSPEPSCFCSHPQPWGHSHLCITLAHTLGGYWGFKLRFSLFSDSPLQSSSRTLNCTEPVLTANDTWHFRDALSVVTPVFPFPEWTPGPLVP